MHDKRNNAHLGNWMAFGKSLNLHAANARCHIDCQASFQPKKKKAIWEAMLQESAFDSIVQSFPLYQLNEQDSKANFFLARIELM